MGIQLGRVNHLARKKQHLTPDSGPEDVVQIACDLCGLHATRATTPYPSLLARCRDFLNQQANVRQVQEMLPLP